MALHLAEWLLLASALLTALHFWLKHHYAYWRRKNVPYVAPNMFFGNLKDMILMQSCAADHITNLYNHKNAQDQPVIGMYILNKPGLLVRDLEVVKSILIKDFNKFSDRYSSCDPHGDALGNYNLFFIKNPYWRELRTKLTSVFTSGKLKQMFPLIEEIGCELDQYLCGLTKNSGTKSCVEEMKRISSLYTTDVIASVAFGVQANSLKNPQSEFQEYSSKIFNFTLYRAFEFDVIFFLPCLVSLFGCKLFSKVAAKFMRDTINFVMKQRVTSGAQRNDLIDVLVGFEKAAKGNKDEGDLQITNDMLVAQAAAFFNAGFETASSTMAFGLYELARNPDLQKRLRQEIKENLDKNNGKVTHEMLWTMEYLNMVVMEVLRLYPPLPFLDRACTLSEGEDEYSLKPFVDFAIPNGMPVYIPVYAIQRDPKYFPNPNQFDPERFSPENLPNVIPYSYLPFGKGPHNCIGERLGIIQSKIGLINFLKNHYVETCEKTLKEMVLEPKALLVQAKGGIFCKLVHDPL